MTTTHHPITVVGGGLGGLTLAAVLARHGIEAAVYDLDASPDARHQGGMLDMHEESGQTALRAAGVYDGFLAAVQPGGEAMKVLDSGATVRYQDAGGQSGRPEVSRGDLRDLLLGAVPAGAVRWGAKVTGARPLGGGRHEVTFADGRTVTTDLLVGADGAWSRVRPLLSDATPTYSGLSMVELTLLDADTRRPAAAALVGSGIMFALGAGRGILAHRCGDGRLDAAAALTVPEAWVAGLPADPAAAKALLLDHFDGWDAGLRSLISDADGEPEPRPISWLPIGHRWDRVPGVTLLGDAAHLMSPFAGEGANLAMLDATELAHALAAHPGDPETALAGYESAMFPRAAAAAAESAANLELSFRADAPTGLAALMSSYHQPA